jgi:hypothetical protein
MSKKNETKPLKQPAFSCRCFIYGDEDRCYYYGTDAWGNYQWGNDKEKARRFTGRSAEQCAIMFIKKGKKVWIGVDYNGN